MMVSCDVVAFRLSNDRRVDRSSIGFVGLEDFVNIFDGCVLCFVYVALG